jgi:hypothetical protein
MYKCGSTSNWNAVVTFVCLIEFNIHQDVQWQLRFNRGSDFTDFLVFFYITVLRNDHRLR